MPIKRLLLHRIVAKSASRAVTSRSVISSPPSRFAAAQVRATIGQQVLDVISTAPLV
jgi:hypothetical protein